MKLLVLIAALAVSAADAQGIKIIVPDPHHARQSREWVLVAKVSACCDINVPPLPFEFEMWSEVYPTQSQCEFIKREAYHEVEVAKTLYGSDGVDTRYVCRMRIR
jgi:hypothetical protein